MTERVQRFLDMLNAKAYRAARREGGENITAILDEECPTLIERSARRFVLSAAAERPMFFGEDDIFGFNLSNVYLPRDDAFKQKRAIPFGNVTVDYETVLAVGLDGIAEQVKARYDDADADAKLMYDCILQCFVAARELVDKYRSNAINNKPMLAEALNKVPFGGATTLYEALVSLRFMQYVLRVNGTPHVTWGRFDQYLKPYFDRSVASGMSKDEALEMIELFFIAINLDTDVYFGIQQGDNGQSMVLGGMLPDGSDGFNELSELCLTASEELRLIDPKINIRVNKNTPLALYERGTRLTKQGLGFPQYSNDDVVIPALIEWGYEPSDARNYVVAACWEFIIPGCGADIPNHDCLNFPLAVLNAIRTSLTDCNDYNEFFAAVMREVNAQADALIDKCNAITQSPQALLSAFVSPCIERGVDVASGGAKYNNYGLLSAGIANAVDSLAAVKKLVFEGNVQKETLIAALNSDFVGYEDLLAACRACPKMGNNDDYVDLLMHDLLDEYAAHLKTKRNKFGGVIRGGTGSAQYYVQHGNKMDATPDGRRAFSPYSSSFSPSLITRTQGPLSAIQSFLKYDTCRVCNGGPFTIEIHDTVFRNAEGEKKVAMLVKTYMDLGGHQLQINAVNRDVLIKAQENPQDYQNLIVRVWGWSGYFVELAPVYQNHIISRLEYSF